MHNRIIEEYAERINNTLNLENDFDIENVVIGLDGTLEETTLNSGVIAQLTDLSDEEDKPKFKIQISDLIVSEQRRRFSIAHELGHLFIHLDFLNEEKWANNCRKSIIYHREEMSTGIEETEANTFAAAFLMPTDKFIKVSNCYFNDDRYDLKKIAQQFNVSKESAYYRGVNLGIWV
ncbi:ImmA/IrrE family metallo-endopeptidase [Inconstantimicrobium porci]|uniref:ImmA/IrrE family metallo-endopeptidase n=1 Tax=Inconstantimicrobium porci TaxID=2652291 RepID=A0A7X2N015_9CLOT|nr:ImmA/IrrE family metallo-endopeptidase [Inconstantimicrobium porci]MSR92272.1 ImmA/IrrE family metallo-endopeptidase [Inconstantimicrobium porci]